LDENAIDFPSATHAIVCETVKVLPLLKLLIGDIKMQKSVVFDDDDFNEQEEEVKEEKDDEEEENEDEPPGGEKSTKVTRVGKIKASLAYVLLYELLLSPGKSIKPPPPPPREEGVEEQKK
jgi:hypothetical protein